jgi:hypothetical protein
MMLFQILSKALGWSKNTWQHLSCGVSDVPCTGAIDGAVIISKVYINLVNDL